MFSLNKFPKFSFNKRWWLARDFKRTILTLMRNSSGVCDRNHLLSRKCLVLKVLLLFVICVKQCIYIFIPTMSYSTRVHKSDVIDLQKL